MLYNQVASSWSSVFGTAARISIAGCEFPIQKDIHRGKLLRNLKGKRPVGKRFILAGDSVWMSDITTLLKSHSKKVSSREMPDLMTKMVAAFDPNVKSVLSNVWLML